MTTGTLTLADFLLARIAEDETQQRSWGAWHAGTCQSVGSGMEINAECDCGVPARVLAECEAKRRIIEIHTLIRAAYPGTTVDSDPCCDACSGGGEYPGDGFPCPTLRAVVAVYGAHPDYRDEWRP